MPIVAGFITSKEGKAALTAAIGEAKLRNSTLVLLHSSKTRSGSEADIEAQLDEAKAVLAESGVEYEIRTSPGNDPADELVRTAEEVDACLIVIGLRRRTPVGKLILGSNAQRVLLDAGCPVLAVKSSG